MKGLLVALCAVLANTGHKGFGLVSDMCGLEEEDCDYPYGRRKKVNTKKYGAVDGGIRVVVGKVEDKVEVGETLDMFVQYIDDRRVANKAITGDFDWVIGNNSEKTQENKTNDQ